jgi:3-phosphoshikimate 1-carboxyvinyltransferase
LESIRIRRKSKLKGTIAGLPSSKSLSNRALIIEALAGNQSVVSNLSSARDTVLMKKLVRSEDHEINVMDAGTTMRFLTAYFALTNQKKVLTGSARMKERPIALLVDALRAIGASISYLEREGFPPLETKGFAKQVVREVEVPGNVSSQYISALMMTAPVLPQGLSIRLTGKVGSRPYIDMTASLMKHFGVEVQSEGNNIHIPKGKYNAVPYRVEPDWSAASYWFAFTALAQEAEIFLPEVTAQSRQGDIAIVEIMSKLGVTCTFDSTGLALRKGGDAQPIRWDFVDCPDLAQTVLPVCACLKVPGTFTGLESLLIKETDRIAALQNELAKVGASLSASKSGEWLFVPGDTSSLKALSFDTYHDHRMAMGLAPLATRTDVTIHDPRVTDKSYPTYWDDIRSLGFDVDQLIS